MEGGVILFIVGVRPCMKFFMKMEVSPNTVYALFMPNKMQYARQQKKEWRLMAQPSIAG